MRRIADPAEREHGAIAVVVAVLMVVLLGFAAISVDVAKLYSERVQLQNGADAAALMVAQKCAKNDAVDCSVSSPMAAELANKNAVDSLSNVKSIVLDESGRTVQVTAGAQEAGASTNRVSMVFAGVLGFPTAEVTATSWVEWGSPKAGRTVFPLAVSVCQVNGMVGNPDSHLVQIHGKGTSSSCPHPNSSGSVVPGGFAWLTSDPGACGATVDLAEKESATDPGAMAPTQCKAELERWINDIAANRKVIIYLPVYDHVGAEGKNAVYNLVSFAALEVRGWRFTGDDKNVSPLPYTFRNNVAGSPSCVEDCRGIIGRFVEYVSLGEGFTLGPVTNGAYVVRLTR